MEQKFCFVISHSGKNLNWILQTFHRLYRSLKKYTKVIFLMSMINNIIPVSTALQGLKTIHGMLNPFKLFYAWNVPSVFLILKKKTVFKIMLFKTTHCQLCFLAKHWKRKMVWVTILKIIFWRTARPIEHTMVIY